jgi:transposase
LCVVASESDTVPEPRDLAEAREIIATLHKQQLEIEARSAQLEERLVYAECEKLRLQHELDVLLRRIFGKRSEKVDPNQLQLMLGIVEAHGIPGQTALEADSGERIPRERKKARAHGRQVLPAELPRRVEVVDVPESERICRRCGAEKAVIGHEVLEKLEFVPASYHVVQTKRVKRACPAGHGVTVAPSAPQAVEKSMAAEGLLAQVVVSKYADHLPLHRQEGILARHGVTLSRSTQCDWVRGVARACEPIVEEMRRQVLQTDYLQTDDTTVVVLGGGEGSFKGRLWTYLDPLGRQVVFEATATHERAGPEAFLSSFQGYLQADAYKGYDALYASGRIVEIACWAHGRRRFKDALDTDPRAAAVLALVQRLYAVEDEAKELAPEERRALRQERSVPVLTEIDELRRKLQLDVLPKSPLGDALRYLDNQWAPLQRFVENGRLAIDNNRAENQLRIVAVGRKNWLFAGSLEGARWTAILYSLVQSCRLVGIDPFVYFRDVLRRLPTHPQRLIAQLTPRRWVETAAVNSAA